MKSESLLSLSYEASLFLGFDVASVLASIETSAEAVSFYQEKKQAAIESGINNAIINSLITIF